MAIVVYEVQVVHNILLQSCYMYWSAIVVYNNYDLKYCTIIVLLLLVLVSYCVIAQYTPATCIGQVFTLVYLGSRLVITMPGCCK